MAKFMHSVDLGLNPRPHDFFFSPPPPLQILHLNPKNPKTLSINKRQVSTAFLQFLEPLPLNLDFKLKLSKSNN